MNQWPKVTFNPIFIMRVEKLTETLFINSYKFYKIIEFNFHPSTWEIYLHYAIFYSWLNSIECKKNLSFHLCFAFVLSAKRWKWSSVENLYFHKFLSCQKKKICLKTLNLKVNWNTYKNTELKIFFNWISQTWFINKRGCFLGSSFDLTVSIFWFYFLSFLCNENSSYLPQMPSLS